MMSIAHLLEDFTPRDVSQNVTLTEVSLEENRLEAFESGYKAGWDDSANAAKNDEDKITVDFANNLRDLSFTYHEACSGMMSALEPLLTSMVKTVLPKLAHQTLGLRVINQLSDMARENINNPIEIVTAPTNLDALRSLVEQQNDLPITIVTEPSCGEGQVHIRTLTQEYEIDIDGLLNDIDLAVNGFINQPQKETA